MKVVILSGDPFEQETFLKNLIKELDKEGNTVYLHNALHNEMYSAVQSNVYFNSSYKNDGNYKVVNSQLLDTGLASYYEAPLLGHSCSLSFSKHRQFFDYAANNRLKEIIKVVYPTTLNTELKHLHTSIIASVDAIKYIDVMIIYNVIDIKGTLVSKYHSSTLDENRWFWYNFPSNSFDGLFNRSTEECENIAKSKNIIYSNNAGKEDSTALIKQVVKYETPVYTSNDMPDYEVSGTTEVYFEEPVNTSGDVNDIEWRPNQRRATLLNNSSVSYQRI